MRASIFILGFLILAGCNNLMDADITQRETFIKLFNGTQGVTATDCLIVNDGYVILGNMTNKNDSLLTVAIRTDDRGNRIGNTHYYFGGFGAAIKALPNNQGYLVVGERIKISPGEPQTDNIIKRSARMLVLNNDLDSITSFYRVDETINEIKADYKAVALTTTTDKVIILGTYQKSLSQPERPYIDMYSGDLQSLQWRMDFESEGRSYKNAKSIHYANGNILWASAIALTIQNFNYSWVSVPTVPEGSIFENASVIGATTDQQFIPSDIQPFNATSFGYGIVGTHANPDGTLSNMFFLRADAQGNIIPSSIKFFDAVRSSNNDPVTKVESDVQDFGTALTATRDGGFVLAGHYITTPPDISNIVLIKIDGLGNMVWIKTIGGTGSETVSAIRETEDRGLLICGTHVIGAVPSIFLIKTDKNGELTK